MSFVKIALDLLFPIKCPFCGRIIKNAACCADCFQKLEFTEDDIFHKHENSCDGITAVVYYNNIVKQGIHRLKFSKRPAGYVFFADEMIKKINYVWKDLLFDCVLYVPMTKKRLNKHGYNQSYLLAKRISKKKGIRLYKNLLVKARETPP